MARQRAAAPAVPTVERRIFFFRANCGQDDAGRPLPFDVRPALQYLDKLPFDDSRYLTGADGRQTVLWVDRSKTNPTARIGNVRRSGLPAVEQRGKLSPLSIPVDSGIAEQTHSVFFPKNIVGIEFNFYGPRPSKLAAYLVAKAHTQCPELVLEALLRQDVADQLKRLQDVRLLQLRIRRSFVDTVTAADKDLGSSFKAAAKAGDADEIEVVLRSTRYAKKPLSAALLGTIKKLFKSTDLQAEVSRFVVKGLDEDSDHVEEVDLLSADLLTEKRIVLQDDRYRAVQSLSAYAAIDEAHRELKDEIAKAAGVLQ